MIECSLAQGCEGERQGTAATNCTCCLCLEGSHWDSAFDPITESESLAY